MSLLHRLKKMNRKSISCDAELKTKTKLRYSPGLYSGVGNAGGL